jgi:hypothetical protein
MRDVAFLIPVRAGVDDRVRILDTVVGYLRGNFGTTILIGEHDREPRLKGRYPDCGYVFIHSDSDLFHKTRVMNVLCMETRAPIVFLQDSDCLVAAEAYVRAAEVIRSTDVAAMFPYDRKRVSVPLGKLEEVDSVRDMALIDEAGCVLEPAVRRHGGIVGYRRDSLIRFGMNNENIVSWGLEDMELENRLARFGIQTVSLAGFHLYHFDHFKTVNSRQDNPCFNANNDEYSKVSFMAAGDLAWYVSQWEWMGRAHGSEMPIYDKEPWSQQASCWAHNVKSFVNGSVRKKWVTKDETGTESLVVSPVDRGSFSIVGIPVLLCFKPFSPPDLMDASIHIAYRGRERFEVYVSDGADAMSEPAVVVGRSDKDVNVVDIRLKDMCPILPRDGIKSVFLRFGQMEDDFVLDEMSLRWG